MPHVTQDMSFRGGVGPRTVSRITSKCWTKKSQHSTGVSRSIFSRFPTVIDNWHLRL